MVFLHGTLLQRHKASKQPPKQIDLRGGLEEWVLQWGSGKWKHRHCHRDLLSPRGRAFSVMMQIRGAVSPGKSKPRGFTLKFFAKAVSVSQALEAVSGQRAISLHSFSRFAEFLYMLMVC